MRLQRVGPDDVSALAAFLSDVDLTVGGLDEVTVRLWVERNVDGAIVASTGYEISDDGQHALIRSVAVHPSLRSAGVGSRLARFALASAGEAGARRAWLFSRRSGPFWQRLGFTTADRNELANLLARTQQVQLFQQNGQLDHEVAWSRALSPAEAEQQ